MDIKYDLSNTYLMTNTEFKRNYGTDRPRCKNCQKYYRLPASVFTPRDKICFTCELHFKKTLVLNSLMKGINENHNN